MYLLCCDQELLSSAVRRIAAFDLVQPSYALAAFAVGYGEISAPQGSPLRQCILRLSPKDRKMRRCLETAALHLPPAALAAVSISASVRWGLCKAQRRGG